MSQDRTTIAGRYLKTYLITLNSLADRIDALTTELLSWPDPSKAPNLQEHMQEMQQIITQMQKLTSSQTRSR